MNQYEILKKYFGYDFLREGQAELIDALLRGQNVLGIMPTGAGKSICYQIPALMFPSVSLVISPLVSLMIDQVKALKQAGIPAAYINSALTDAQIAKALDFAKQGKYKIIYVAPERLETIRFMEFAMEMEISFVAVDEAHCVSQWGQDFRPSYVKIAEFLSYLPKMPVVGAFTATATERVREDIQCILQLKDPKLVVTGFDRKNLFFKVVQAQRKRTKNPEILAYVKNHGEECGIIYCATRKNVEAVWEMLQQAGVLVGKYHAGMGMEERKRNQEDFIYDNITVMVATNAFGMGIDKSNVRYVLHYNMPQSLENYYQEAGRAGRDGENAECILFYSPQDMVINRFLLDSKTGSQEILPEEAKVLRENDELRLNQMHQYCLTRGCLRQYILQYFGEAAAEDCGNCGNCLAEFEEKDVTDICKKIILCMEETKQRFGANVIADVLLGKNTAKVRSFGLQELESFGLCKEQSQAFLKTVLFELEEQCLIESTKDKYHILKLSPNCKEMLEEKQQIMIKLSKDEPQEETKPVSPKSRRADILNAKGKELFDCLRELRLTFAREASLPPYIIFSDKTLVDLCGKVPMTKEEMLKVNGIGEYKFEKYGEAFLAEIRKFIGAEGVPPTYEENGDSLKKERDEKDASKKRKGKEPFTITEEIYSKIVYEESMTITDFVKMINDCRNESTMKALSTKMISAKLKEEGYYKEEYIDGIWKKGVLPEGLELGIFPEERTAKSGLTYFVLKYDRNAQVFMVESLQGRWLEGED
ncbi:MAG: DNA helicase RecQ [Anaerotignum sp.]|nr:DNA helicase RecQ [Anaerotignum sp.]